MVYDLLDTEGLYMGASSALNVVAAVELAEKLGRGRYFHLKVTLSSIDSFHRLDGCNHLVRRRVSLPKSTLLEKVARQQRTRRRHPIASQEICSSGLGSTEIEVQII